MEDGEMDQLEMADPSLTGAKNPIPYEGQSRPECVPC